MAESLHKNSNFDTGVDFLPYLWTAACKGNAVSVLQLDAGRSQQLEPSCAQEWAAHMLLSVQLLFSLPITLVSLVEKNYIEQYNKKKIAIKIPELITS